MLTNKKVVLLGSSKKNPTLDLDFSKTPQIDPQLTWARNTTATVVDFEGLVKTAKANEARFAGARRVENLVASSNDFTTASWTLSNVIVTKNISDPYGTFKASTLTASANSGYINNGGRTLFSIANAVSITSFWIRRRTGSGAIYLYCGNSNIGNIAAKVSSSWTLLSYNKNQTDTESVLYMQLAINGDAIDIVNPMIEDATGQTIKIFSGYVSRGELSYPYHGAGVDGVKYFPTTNGNTVSSNVVTEAPGVQLTGITLLAEEVRINLLLNSATPATQNITTTAQAYTISISGTGTCTLTGTATGTLTGTGAGNRVPITVTTTAGTLTLTFAGTNTNGQAEAGSTLSSYIPTAGASVTRVADVPSFTGAGLSWYNAQQGTFVVKASGQAFRIPSAFGTFNLTLPTAGTYVVVYNNAIKDGSTYLYTLANGATPVEYTGIADPITTVTLLNGGLANLSAFTYYPKALKASKIVALLS